MCYAGQMTYAILALLSLIAILLASIAYGVSIFVLRAKELCEDEQKMVKRTIVVSGGIVMIGQFFIALGLILAAILGLHWLLN